MMGDLLASLPLIGILGAFLIFFGPNKPPHRHVRRQ